MIARLVWIVALIGIAAVTSYAQLDRQARYAPHLAASVPEAFRSFAQPHITTAAIEAGDADTAVAEARRLIERRPIPAEHLSLLATAQFKADQPQAAMTIQLAAQRGWRELAAQQAMLRLATRAGNGGEAARRYAALLQNKASDKKLLLGIGPKVFQGADAEARAVFTGLLASGERWHSTFLDRGAQVMPADAFAAIIRDSANRGVRFDCQRLKSAAAILANRDPAVAEELARDALKFC